MLHKMNLNSEPFEMIRCGEKTIELRLYDEKRKMIRVGDGIIFTEVTTGETVSAEVIGLHIFDSFYELYRALPLLKCGYTPENVGSASHTDMREYYSEGEEKKYGVIGIELCLV